MCSVRVVIDQFTQSIKPTTGKAQFSDQGYSKNFAQHSGNASVAERDEDYSH